MRDLCRQILRGSVYPSLLLLVLLISSCDNLDDPTAKPIVTLAITPSLTTPRPITPISTSSPTIEISPTPFPTPQPTIFDGDSAYQKLLEQMEFGARWPGSAGHKEVGDYIVEQLTTLGWTVEEQRFDYQHLEGRNIIGRVNQGEGPIIILGAHYDTRKIADHTPGSTEPVPGAVDGASGVAVLLELARTLEIDEINHEIWLTFFDVEDNGSNGIPGFEWIVGSTFMADNLKEIPESMIVVDMIGDSDQQLFYEGNSDPALQGQLWQVAFNLGYGDYFIPQYRHTMIDDHLPFAMRGIPAVDIIDFDYPYWHTVEDTVDKASPESLTRVGRTIETWLESK